MEVDVLTVSMVWHSMKLTIFNLQVEKNASD